MFSFFLKKDKIYLDCFTNEPDLATLFPFRLASEKLPGWFKHLPNGMEFHGPIRGTMKTCPGVSDLFRSGFIIVNWLDVYIDVSNNKIDWMPKPRAESHNSGQWDGPKTSFLKDFYHLKLVSPWKMREKTGIKWLFTNPFWYDDTFKPLVVNGMVEYKYQHTTSVNMLVPKNMFPKNITIPAGKELAHVIPLSDKEIVLKTHVVTDNEMKKLDPLTFAFQGNYFKRKKILKDLGR